MTCRDFDRLLSDYLDQILRLDDRRRLEEHARSCPACAENKSDAEMALTWLRQAPAVELPPGLIPQILHGTLGAGSLLPAAAGGGRVSWGVLDGFLNPLFEPRFAMSMAMAVLSFSMVAFSGQHAWQQWQAGRTGPIAAVASVGQQLEQVWSQGIELYEALRISYEIESEFGGVDQTNGTEPAPPAPGSGPGEQQP
jgi:hypothetical protein